MDQKEFKVKSISLIKDLEKNTSALEESLENIWDAIDHLRENVYDPRPIEGLMTHLRGIPLIKQNLEVIANTYRTNIEKYE